jgi:hypothetical protein
VRDLYFVSLSLLLWLFNFVAPTCSFVVVVLHGSVGEHDVLVGRGFGGKC